MVTLVRFIVVTVMLPLFLTSHTESRWHELYEKISASDDTSPANPGEVEDIDGNSYETVKIGNQVWMAENLRVTRYRNGDPIPRVEDDEKWMELKEGGYSFYMNFWYFGRVYGAIYNWHAVEDERGICPEGWRVPDDKDWRILSNYLGGNKEAGGKLKASSLRWMRPNEGGKDKTGFSALPGGYRHSNGTFYNIRRFGDFWSSVGFPDGYAYFRSFCNEYPYMHEGVYSKNSGAYIRCIKKD